MCQPEVGSFKQTKLKCFAGPEPAAAQEDPQLVPASHSPASQPSAAGRRHRERWQTAAPGSRRGWRCGKEHPPAACQPQQLAQGPAEVPEGTLQPAVSSEQFPCPQDGCHRAQGDAQLSQPLRWGCCAQPCSLLPRTCQQQTDPRLEPGWCLSLVHLGANPVSLLVPVPTSLWALLHKPMVSFHLPPPRPI